MASSPSRVLPATSNGPFSSRFRAANAAAIGGLAGGFTSNFRFPLTCTPLGGRSHPNQAACVFLALCQEELHVLHYCAAAISEIAGIRAVSGQKRAHSPRPPPHPRAAPSAAGSARIRFRPAPAAWDAAPAGRRAPQKADRRENKKRWSRRSAHAPASVPVSVVVETTMRQPGNCVFSSSMTREIASTSPTETAWIQIVLAATWLEQPVGDLCPAARSSRRGTCRGAASPAATRARSPPAPIAGECCTGNTRCDCNCVTTIIQLLAKLSAACR